MTDTYKIIYSCGGKSFEISPDSPVKLLAGGLSGFDSTGFEVKITPYASLFGGYASTRRLAERELSITAEIDRLCSNGLRREIMSMLDPQKEGELDVTLFGVHRKISVIPCGTPTFERATLGDHVIMTLHFIAPAVFFSDISKKRAEYYCAMPLLTFPMNFTAEGGVTTGLYGKTDHATLDNSGDTECGIAAIIVANGGQVVSPTVSLGEKFIRCPFILEDGDVLAIDTRPAMKNIYLNGERCFIFDRNSTFFTLPSGESVVNITAESGGEYIDARVEYAPLYFGV
ncbi:MAG: phage tail family protein [Clostridia bacterium]|nr:phage tail family protein [Clostridia bacterium]